MYVVHAESTDGYVGYVTIDTEEELEEFIERLRQHPDTHRYAIIPLSSLTFVELNPLKTQEERDAEIRARAKEIQDEIAADPERAKSLPGVEIDGFKFVDASGQGLPEEIVRALAQAMEEQGALIRDPLTGKLVKGDSALEEGTVAGMEIRLDEDGELLSSRPIDVNDKSRLN